MSRRFFLPLVMTAAASLFACSSSSSTNAPPEVKDFALTPTTLEVNKATALTGGCTINDPEGDIVGLSGELLFPDGHVVPISDQPLAAGSAKTVPVAIQIPSLTLPAVGEYTLSVYARDSAGNHSPKVTLKLTAK